jgi:hypothetical protein
MPQTVASRPTETTDKLNARNRKTTAAKTMPDPEMKLLVPLALLVGFAVALVSSGPMPVCSPLFVGDAGDESWLSGSLDEAD